MSKPKVILFRQWPEEAEAIVPASGAIFLQEFIWII